MSLSLNQILIPRQSYGVCPIWVLIVAPVPAKKSIYLLIFDKGYIVLVRLWYHICFLIVSPVVVHCQLCPKAAGMINHSSHSNSLTNPRKCMLHSMKPKGPSPINLSPYVVSFVDYFINYLPNPAIIPSFMHNITTDLTVRLLLLHSARWRWFPMISYAYEAQQSLWNTPPVNWFGISIIPPHTV